MKHDQLLYFICISSCHDKGNHITTVGVMHTVKFWFGQSLRIFVCEWHYVLHSETSLHLMLTENGNSPTTTQDTVISVALNERSILIRW